MRYLELQFHDNDFSQDLLDSVRQIWSWVASDHKGHSLEKNRRSISDSFLFLHKEKILEKMIRKMVILSAINHDVEWATRGLFRERPSSPRKIKDISEDLANFERHFLKLKVAFYDSKDFINDWQNAEHVWFDLKIGCGGYF